jgi:hypothetical protein
VDLSGSGVLTGFANLEVVKSSTLPALELLNGLTVREIEVLICPPRIPIIFTLTQRLGPVFGKGRCDTWSGTYACS